jgi:TRAP-type mannitol/chloroaromatic compound transport system substrate-binding protein
MQAKYDYRNPAALKQLLGNKTKLVAMPRPIMDAAFKESMALYSELSASNPAWKKIYDDYSNFRREANQWFRFTEARFDNFMQTAKL